MPHPQRRNLWVYPSRSLTGRPFLLAGLLPALFALTGSLRGQESQTTGGRAEPPPADKSRYHLFHPVPQDLLRELSTDRPDKTESAYTVDAGHFQLEMDLLNYTYDHDTKDGMDQKVHSFVFAPVNLKAGLTNRVDLQLLLESFNSVRTRNRVAGVTENESGFGDVLARLKVNLFGNDGGPAALAAMGFVKIPTNQGRPGNHTVEGGLVLPLALELPLDFDLGVMAEVDILEDLDKVGVHPEVTNTITLGHAIYGSLAGYLEFFSILSTERESDWAGTVDLGLTYRVTAALQLDLGINIGVTDSADDWNPFLGLAVRF